MSLESAIANLRRTLEARQPSPRHNPQASRARTGNTELLVIQAQAVIREFDRQKSEEMNAMYPF